MLEACIKYSSLIDTPVIYCVCMCLFNTVVEKQMDFRVTTVVLLHLQITHHVASNVCLKLLLKQKDAVLCQHSNLSSVVLVEHQSLCVCDWNVSPFVL